MSTYGTVKYGTNLYGFSNPPDFRVDPFVAKSVNYDTISVSWSIPSGNILAWRLVKNMYGLPTDQDDGEILVDSSSGYPGNSFSDVNVIPSKYHYYGFFLLVNFTGNQWVRSATTGCLAVKDYGSGLMIHELIPGFFRLRGGLNVNNVDNFPSEILDFFCVVLGWGVDYLRTQYDTYLNLNDPWLIPVPDLFNLAAQLGVNVNPDVHPFTIRKAVFNNAVVNRRRGTNQGIELELSSLTGWNADIRTGRNFMLENDQSEFLDPVFPQWSQYLAYNIGESVSFGNYWYQCIATNNYGHSPSGTSSSNSWWSPILSVNNGTYLLNATTGGINTWELLYPSAMNGVPSASAFFETLGVADPLNASIFNWNSLQGANLSGGSATIWLRSVSRSVADLVNVTTTFAPDKDQVTGDGIPVPFAIDEWSPSVRYDTNSVVLYENQPFTALRASTDVVPPYLPIVSTNNEWAPAGMDQRLRLCVSGYLTGSSAVPITPFVEWYDSGGNFISRVFSRNSLLPTSFAFDSFTAGAGTYVSGRTTDDGSSQWSVPTGSFSVSPFSLGCAYPTIQGQRSVSVVNPGIANCQVAVTFVTNPSVGQSEGLLLRYQNDNNYLRADQSTLRLKSSGSWSTLGTYSNAFLPGDRMTVQLNGSTITVLRNNVQVLQVTNSFNVSGTAHGIINENT